MFLLFLLVVVYLWSLFINNLICSSTIALGKLLFIRVCLMLESSLKKI